MGLINLQTNLKSLRFGNDRVHSGNSGQPYIQTPIPEQLGGFGALDTDFLLRGGSRAVVDSVKDVERLGKYFTDVRNPSGLLFIAKQNLLSRTAVRTQASGLLLNEGAYTPISTLLEAGGVAFGLHVNKQGLNPFDGPGSLRTYTDVVKVGNLIQPLTFSNAIFNNRLLRLNDLIISNSTSILPPSGEILNLGNNVITYSGGPGSILGIGKTNIRFADQRTSWGTDKKLGSQVTQNGTFVLTPSQIVDASELNKTRSTPTFTPQTQDFRKVLRGPNGGIILDSTVISNSPNYSGPEAKNIEKRVNLGDPGNRTGKNLASYVNGAGEGAASIEGNDSYDKITARSLYESNNVLKDSTLNDLVKFRIEVINNEPNGKNVFIHFRAFLDNMSDSYDANWNATQYIGRGEKFYTYGGFDRKVSLSWTVAAQSKIELIPMYKKLNYLASTLAPDYSSVGGFMRGNLVKLTVGGYFFEQPGIITSLSYEIKEDSPWEIGINDDGGNDPSVKELPHVIKVTGFNFIPIHEFVPRKQINTYVSTTEGEVINFGNERYIALANGGGKDLNNYDS